MYHHSLLHSPFKSASSTHSNGRPSTTNARLGSGSLASTSHQQSPPPPQLPPHHKSPNSPTSPTASTTVRAAEPAVQLLDEPQLHALITDYKRSRSPAAIVRTLTVIFSSRHSLAGSFQKRPPSHLDQLLERAPADLRSLKKEDLRSLEGDLDKDEDDSAEAAAAASDSDDGGLSDDAHHAVGATTNVDLQSLRRCLHRLYDTYTPAFETLNQSLYSLALSMPVDMEAMTRAELAETVDVFLIVFETIAVAASEFVDLALPAVCCAASVLPTWAQAQLARNWAALCTGSMKEILQALQQLISLKVSGGGARDMDMVYGTVCRVLRG